MGISSLSTGNRFAGFPVEGMRGGHVQIVRSFQPVLTKNAGKSSALRCGIFCAQKRVFLQKEDYRKLLEKLGSVKLK